MAAHFGAGEANVPSMIDGTRPDWRGCDGRNLDTDAARAGGGRRV